MAPCKRDGCAFFGSDATNGYCSKCYKMRVQQTTTTTPISTAEATNSKTDQTAVRLGETIASSTAAINDDRPSRDAAETRDGATSAAAAGAAARDRQEAGSSFNEEEEAVSTTATMVEMADHAASQKADGLRCYSCNKKLRLVDKFTCRCGEVFCSSHRHFKDHSCTFDYKASGRAAIAKANPIVTGSKLKKI